jgi:predicted GTPase
MTRPPCEGGAWSWSKMATIARVDADVVVAATPVDLAHLVPIDKRVVRARYEFAETETPGLGGCVDDWLARLSLRSR